MSDMDQIISLLQIPSEAFLNRTVPKTFFSREFDLTPDERRLLGKPHLLEKIQWVARLRLNTINIPPYKSETERFLEIQVFTVDIHPEKYATYQPKIEHLLFKYIPYPLILISRDSKHFHISFASHHLNPHQPEQLVIDQIYRIELPLDFTKTEWSNQSLQSDHWLSRDLKVLHQNYLQKFIALEVSTLTKKNCKPDSPGKMKEAHKLLQSLKQTSKEIESTKKAIKKCRQINEKVELGTKLHEIAAQREQILKKLLKF